MSLSKTARIDLILALTMLTGASFVEIRPVEKSQAANKLELKTMVPESFGSWVSQTFDTSDYADKWQSINELLVRGYAKPNLFSFRSPATEVAFVLEYSSDLRQNFSFHFPENCHRAHGNEIQFLPTAEIDLGNGKILRTKQLFIKGQAGSTEKKDKIVTYWLVMEGKQYYKTFFIKMDQMLSGLLSHAKSGFLVRVDYEAGLEYTPEGLEKASTVTNEFIRELYESLDPDKRSLLFGKEFS